MDRCEVVVTGIGVVSPIGNDKDSFWESLISGISGVTELKYTDYPNYTPNKNEAHKAGLIKNLVIEDWFPETTIKQFDYPTLTILKAVEEAINDSKVQLSNKIINVIVSSAVGLRPPYTRLQASLKPYASGRPEHLPQPQYYPANIMEFAMDTVLGAIFKKFKLSGEGLCFSTICASGATAICIGTELIRNKCAEIVLCVTFDHFHPRQNRVFSHFKLLTDEKNKPFDKMCKGFQLGEAVGTVILENRENAQKRHAHIYGEILGYGVTNDAYHLVISSLRGEEFSKAIEKAIVDTNICPEAIDYICLCGRGSKMTDIKELNGVKKVFGSLLEKIPINCITPYIGHTLGAHSMLDFIVTLLQMEKKVILPILNFETPYKEFSKVNFVKQKIFSQKINIALICTHAFTGINTAIIVKKNE